MLALGTCNALQNCSDHVALVLQVLEETGFDISSRLKSSDYIEIHMQEKRCRLYIIQGVSESTTCLFAPSHGSSLCSSLCPLCDIKYGMTALQPCNHHCPSCLLCLFYASPTYRVHQSMYRTFILHQYPCIMDQSCVQLNSLAQTL